MIFSRQRVKKNQTLLQNSMAELEERLRIATQCLENISNGNFEFELNHLREKAGEESSPFTAMLSKLKERLAEYSQKERERSWAAEGLSKFMELLHGEKANGFYDRILKLLVSYTGANQGGIFLLNDADANDLHLEMVACYAYDRKKFSEKRIEIGQGLLGQCFIEKASRGMTEVPHLYTSITSGLGEATPRFLLLVPMKYNNDVSGVIEMAYFQKLQPYQVEFIEKIAENLASVTITMRHEKRVQLLYRESQEKAQMLQAQEEMLRQNIEELVATQEEMERKQKELDHQAQFLKFILDNIPFPVFVKDDKGRYTLANHAEAKLFQLNDHELIGKDDSSFVSDTKEWETIKATDQQVLSSGIPLELPLQRFTTVFGKSYIFKTTKIPFTNPETGRRNILGVSIDLTEKLTMEENLIREKNINRHNHFINVAGRQRMLSQKIGFYAEALLRGRTQYNTTLRHAIELYEHSLHVIRFGGMPIGINSDSPMPSLHDDLIPRIEKIENVWMMYKLAAENILYFSSMESSRKGKINTEQNITIIEENAEELLNLNNDLILAYLQIHTESRANKLLDGFGII